MRIIASFLCCLLWCSVIVAQRDTIHQQLKEISCTGELVPVATSRAVHNVKIIDAKTIQRRAANNLEEVLTMEAGVRFRTDLIIGSGVQMNGIGGENVKILIDGVPMLGRLNGNVDLSQIQLHNVLRIEIIQGSLSTIYGSNASGGVINIITKKTQLKTIDLKAQSQYENVGIQNHNLSVGLRQKKFLAQANAAYYVFDGFSTDTLRSILWNPKVQKSASATLKYYLDDQQQLTYTYGFFDEIVENLGEVKRPKFKPYAFDDYYYTTRNDHSLNYQGTFKKWSLLSTVGYNKFDRQKEAWRTDLTERSQMPRANEQDTSQFTALMNRNVMVYQAKPSLSIQLGTDVYVEEAVGQRIKDTTSQKPNYANIGDYAFFASAKIKPIENQDLTLQPSLRASYNTKYDAPITPALNLLYKMRNHWTLRASYANGFRAPSLKEMYFNFVDINHNIIGTTDIKAERSHNFLLQPGYKISTEKQSVNLDVQGFFNNINDRITLTQLDPITLRYTYINVGNYKTKGVNLNINYTYGERFGLKGSFAYTGFYNDIREQRADVPTYIYSPESSIEVSYRVPLINTNLSILHRYIGELPNFTFDVIKNKVEEGLLQGYQMLNATASRSFWNEKIQVVVGAKNLLNVQNIQLQGNTGSGHGSTGSNVPISFGRSYFIRLAVQLEH